MVLHPKIYTSSPHPVSMKTVFTKIKVHWKSNRINDNQTNLKWSCMHPNCKQYAWKFFNRQCVGFAHAKRLSMTSLRLHEKSCMVHANCTKSTSICTESRTPKEIYHPHPVCMQIAHQKSLIVTQKWVHNLYNWMHTKKSVSSPNHLMSTLGLREHQENWFLAKRYLNFLIRFRISSVQSSSTKADWLARI